MKQRIKLAQALVHDPDLLFLDEPTNGMDPKGRDEMLELVRDLGHNKGVSLILSSHLLPDVEYTCDHVVVMDKGQVAAQGPIDGAEGAARPRLRAAHQRGDLDGFIDVLRAAGLECHATDEDVMRVFVPRRSGGAPRSCSRSRAAERRPGAAPASERADARRRVRQGASARNERRCRSTIRVIGATAAARRTPGRAWIVIARAGIRDDASASARSSACCSSPGSRSSSAPCRSTSRRTSRRRRSSRRPPRRSGSSSSSRTSSSSSSPIYVGAGLIANDRRANALQIYLSKPLMRTEYIAGKLAMLFAFLLFVTLGAGDAAAARCR